mmetsp:Transcript_47307/g.115921  ORF Transcript_47307/g.115921 Transcript_47307/m.115921 type:complete len:302 (+) Transcript_47307:763-1668(+)
MQSVCRVCNEAESAAWSLSVSAKSPWAVASSSDAEAFLCLVSPRDLLSCLILSVNDCFTISKLNLASVSAFSAAERWLSAFSSMSFRISTIAFMPPFGSSWSSDADCRKACKCALSSLAMDTPSNKTVNVLVTLDTAWASTWVNPATFFLTRAKARDNVSMVSLNSAFRFTQSLCWAVRTCVARSKSFSASEMDSDSSPISVSASSMSDSDFSMLAANSSLRDSALLNSCCKLFALSSHHSTNLSYWRPSSSPSLVTLAAKLPRSSITLVTGLPELAAAPAAKHERTVTRMVQQNLLCKQQ